MEPTYVVRDRSRFEELDSLRGFAALTVMIDHYLFVLPAMQDIPDYKLSLGIKLLKVTPLHIFWAGYEAVVFFFILSGFVLSLPFFCEKKLSYGSFLAKRICRIYIPYYFALTLAIAMDLLFSKKGIVGLSAWFNSIWNAPITWSMIVNHVLLIGSFKNGQFDPVLWSLVHEMRISIIFPLLMFLINRVDWKINLAIGVLLSYIGLKIKFTFLSGYSNDYIDTLFYIIMFIVGALLAKHRLTIINKYNKLPRYKKIILLVTGILAYTSRWWLFYATTSIYYYFLVSNWFISFGVLVFIISAFSTTASKILKNSWMLFFGKISFSIYLYHVIVLLTLIYLLYGKISLYFIWIIGIAATLMISTLAYYFIEMPSIKIGRILGNIL